MADATWRCQSCDTYNDANAGKCQVCDEPHTRRRSQKGAGSGQAAGSTWQCRQCDVWNDAGLTACQGCDAKRADATKVPVGVDQGAETKESGWPRRLPREDGTEPAAHPPVRSAGRPTPDPLPPPGGSDIGGPVPLGDSRPIFFAPKGGVTPLPRPLPKRSSSPAKAVAVVAAIVTGLIVLVLALGSHSGSGTAGSSNREIPSSSDSTTSDESPGGQGSDSGQAQAQSVDDLLSKTGSTRSDLRSAIDEVSGCSDVADGISSLQSVLADRQSQVSEAQNLRVDALDNGDAMKTTLVNALSDSLAADQAYLSWARSAESDCAGTAPLTDDYNTGNDESAKAGREKTDFVGLWNPIASNYQLPTRSDDDI